MAYPTVTHTDMAMSAWFIAGVGTGRLPLLAFSGKKALQGLRLKKRASTSLN